MHELSGLKLLTGSRLNFKHSNTRPLPLTLQTIFDLRIDLLNGVFALNQTLRNSSDDRQ